jgi:hypothetical protein
MMSHISKSSIRRGPGRVQSSLGDLFDGSELIYFWKLGHVASCSLFLLQCQLLEVMKCADCSGSSTLNGVLLWGLNADG